MRENCPLFLGTLDSYYPCIAHPDTQRLFGDMARVRAQGYGPDYPTNYLPLDASDYISRIHVCYSEAHGDLTPVATIRSVSLSQCDRFNTSLPLLDSIKLSRSDYHAECLESLLQNARDSRTQILYNSRLTICKSIRKDRTICSRILELAAALTVDDFDLLDASLIVAGAAIRFGTLQLFEGWGYYPLLSPTGDEMPPFPKTEAGSEPIRLIALRSPSPYARACHAANKRLLEDRFAIVYPKTTSSFPVWAGDLHRSPSRPA